MQSAMLLGHETANNYEQSSFTLHFHRAINSRLIFNRACYPADILFVVNNSYKDLMQTRTLIERISPFITLLI